MADVSREEPQATPPGPAEQDRGKARARIERRRKFAADLVAYVVINLGLIVAWAVTGAGDFWPGWVLGIWGVFLLLDAWNVFFRRPVTEEDIDRELRRNRP